VAAPAYLKKRGELRPHHLVVAALACLLLMVPLIGSFVPVPPYPVDIFPYIFLAYMLAGSGWLYITNRRRPGVLREIDADLERTHPPVPTGMGSFEEGHAGGVGVPGGSPVPAPVLVAQEVIEPRVEPAAS
jgi:hypothetical protein